MIAWRARTAFWAGLQYLLFKTGPITSIHFETGGFWSADKKARSPDIQFHLGLGSGIEAGVAAMKPRGNAELCLLESAVARHGADSKRRSKSRSSD
jgi:hypothetical protein